MIALRPARSDEAKSLSELCLRSKAVWGYDQAFLDLCAAELTISPEMLRSDLFQVAEIDGRVAGVAQVIVDGVVANLEKLFVDPKHLRSSVGQTLYAWAKNAAAAAGASSLVIDADPDAAPFYRRMGATDDGFAPSGSIPGRSLPRLRAALG